MHARGSRHGRHPGGQARGRDPRAVRGARGGRRGVPGDAGTGTEGEDRGRGVGAEIGASRGGGDEASQPLAQAPRCPVQTPARIPDWLALRPEPVPGERGRGAAGHAGRPRRRDFQPRRLQRCVGN